MTFREQTTGGVSYNTATVGVVPVPDELLGSAFAGQSQRLIGQKLISGKAIVQFNDLDLVWSYTGFFIYPVRRSFRHIVANQLAQRMVFKGACKVRCHCLTLN